MLRRPVETTRHSGHWLRLGLDASVANDPKGDIATFDAFAFTVTLSDSGLLIKWVGQLEVTVEGGQQ